MKTENARSLVLPHLVPLVAPFRPGVPESLHFSTQGGRMTKKIDKNEDSAIANQWWSNKEKTGGLIGE